jgi:retron-type reverse transcriptase
MADRLTYYLNKYEIAPYTQFSTCKGGSTNETALTLTQDIQNARTKGLVTIALTLDIKGYFDFVNHKNLLSKMRNANSHYQW